MTLPRVEFRGFDKLERDLSRYPVEVGAAIGAGLKTGGVMVQGQAQRKVHSPDNPWPARKDRKTPTGKLQASLAVSGPTGIGLDQEVRVGILKDRGPFRRSAAPGGGRQQRAAAAGLRLNRGRNVGDPRIYGPIEERRHPFLGPALEENRRRITQAIQLRVERILRGLNI